MLLTKYEYQRLNYNFENYSLRSHTRELIKNQKIAPLEPQVFNLLELLIQKRHRLVTKDELNKKIWNGRFVSDAVVNSRIHSARIAIGDNGRTQRLIKTIYGQGFRFVGDVEVVDSAVADNDVIDNLANSNAAYTKQAGPRLKAGQPGPIVVSPMAFRASHSIQRQVNIRQWAMPMILMVSVILIGFLFYTTAYENKSQTDAIESASDSSIRPVSIAVIPFSDFSHSKDHQFLADGIAEELINVLAQISELRVASRTSAFVFRDGTADVQTVSEALDVNYILEGSIRTSGTKVRVTVQLIDARTNYHLWSKTLDRELNAKHLFDLQDQIAQAVLAEIEPQLNLSPTALATRTPSLRAYESYLRGIALMNRRMPEPIEQAIELFQETLAIDANYAPAHAGIVRAYKLGIYYSGMSKADVIEKMQYHVNRAIELAPHSPETLGAQMALAQLYSQHAKVLELADRAIAISPNLVLAHAHKAGVLPILGKIEESLQSYRNAVALDPLSSGLLSNYTWALMSSGHLQEALTISDKNVKWNAKSTDALTVGGIVKRAMGDYVAANELFLKALAVNRKSYGVQESLIDFYLNIGMNHAASKVAISTAQRAKVLALTGEIEEARQLIDHEAEYFGINEAKYYVRDYASAANGFRRTVTNAVAKRESGFPQKQGLWLTEKQYIFANNNEEVARVLATIVDKYYEDKEPKDFSLWEDHLGGIGWRLMHQDVEGALLWLDYSISQGHAFLTLAYQPMFEQLATEPAYTSRLRQMEKIALAHRQKIGGYVQAYFQVSTNSR